MSEYQTIDLVTLAPNLTCPSKSTKLFHGCLSKPSSCVLCPAVWFFVIFAEISLQILLDFGCYIFFKYFLFLFFRLLHLISLKLFRTTSLKSSDGKSFEKMQTTNGSIFFYYIFGYLSKN